MYKKGADGCRCAGMNCKAFLYIELPISPSFCNFVILAMGKKMPAHRCLITSVVGSHSNVHFGL